MQKYLFQGLSSTLAAAVLLAVSPGALAQEFLDFENGCEAGSGSFRKPISRYQEVEVGVIPKYKRAVSIRLASKHDVDVRLMDTVTGEYVVGWFPNGNHGTLHGPNRECTHHAGVQICYSGYNGETLPDGTRSKGEETITFEGDTTRAYKMTAFGYQADSAGAPVNYSWDVTEQCNEQGQGFFVKEVAQGQDVLVGVIPEGVHDVDVVLKSDTDIDMTLYNGEKPLVHWFAGDVVGEFPIGGPSLETAEYAGMSIEYSGYNGIADSNGVQANRGWERITLRGPVSQELTMKVFGYQSGTAEGTFEYGMSVGKTCLGIASLQCAEGLVCKEVQTGVSDPAGKCHTPQWCNTDATAETDCNNLKPSSPSGEWTCTETHTCEWKERICPQLFPPAPGSCESGWETYTAADGCYRFMCRDGYEEVGLEELLSEPTAYDGKRVSVTWETSQSLPICTLMACSFENPCCNSCGAQLQFDLDGTGVNEARILTFDTGTGAMPDQFNCGGNSCTVADGTCGGRAGRELTVYGSVKAGQYGTSLVVHKAD